MMFWKHMIHIARFIWSSIGAISHHISTSYAIRFISLQQKIANIFPRVFASFLFFLNEIYKGSRLFFKPMTLRFCWYQEWFARSWSITGGSVLVIFVTVWWKDSESESVCGPFEARLPYGLPCVLKSVRSLEFWSDDMADWNLVFWCHESIGICRHFQAVRSGWHRVFLRICRGCTDCDGEKHRCLPLW